MNDLKRHNTKLQIFYSFVTNFETLLKTVKEMALSGEPSDYMRAEGICDVVGYFVHDVKNIGEVMERVNSEPIDRS